MKSDRIEKIDALMRAGKNFDTVRKEIFCGHLAKCVFYYINGLTNGDLCEKLLAHLVDDEQGARRLSQNDAASFLAGFPLAESSVETDPDKALYAVYSGCSMLVCEGCEAYLLFDTRKYPTRSIEEPQKDKVLRGSRDGFAEALIPNSALIRRRIRDPRLVFCHLTVGTAGMSDVLICYMEGIADKGYVEKLKTAISSVKTMGLNLGFETLTELMTGKRVFNPFPKVRYTERPDAAAAMLLEGKIVILCDNYPAAMILPTSIFDFLQDTDDFYFSPTIGGYMKFVRNAVYALSLLLTPVWYALQQNTGILPHWFDFLIFEQGESFLPLFVQLLLVEIAIDGLKLASLNTPDTLTNSLSVISGLILGDLAVSVGWLSEQVILYMAFVAIANFTQPSYELGYAFKFMRIITLVFISVWSFPGLFVGIAVCLAFIASNKSVFAGKGYLYPLFPFDARALKKLFFRGKAGDERIL